MFRSSLVFTAAFTLLTGCPDDDDNGETMASETSQLTDGATDTMQMSTTGMTGESMSGESMTSTPMTTDMTTDDMTTDDMTTEPMTTAMTTEMTTDETATDSGGDVCAPEADDDECSMCLKDVCCDELTTCRANADCSCLLDCLDKLGMGAAGLPTCQGAEYCDLQGLPPGGLELSACQAQMCEAC